MTKFSKERKLLIVQGYDPDLLSQTEYANQMGVTKSQFQYWLKLYEPEDHHLLLHSDQGWHYQMKPYCHALKSRGVLQSMSRKGNCYDNAVIENFFGIL